MAPNDKRPDGNLVHLENRWTTLLWINRFGGLTTRQLARLAWTGQTCGMRSAQRTIASLLTDKYIIKRSLDNGGAIYVLSVAGARVLQSEGVQNVSARGHRDLTFDKPLHRLIANEFVIERHLDGWQIWTEFEVQRRLAPVPIIRVKTPETSATGKIKKPNNHLPKIPDGVVGYDGDLVWIEVENAFKSQARISELVHVANRLLREQSGYFVKSPHGQGHYRKMYFVSADPARLYNVFRCFEAHYKNDKIDFDTLSRIELILAMMSSGYVWGGIIRSLAVDSLVYRSSYLDDQKASMLEVFQSGTLDLSTLDKSELWRIFIQVAEIQETPVDRISRQLGMPETTYNDLLFPPGEILNRIDSQALLRELEEKRDEWMDKCTTFTKGDFLQLFSSNQE